jgi:hypothetical protein
MAGTFRGVDLKDFSPFQAAMSSFQQVKMPEISRAVG